MPTWLTSSLIFFAGAGMVSFAALAWRVLTIVREASGAGFRMSRDERKFFLEAIERLIEKTQGEPLKMAQVHAQERSARMYAEMDLERSEADSRRPQAGIRDDTLNDGVLMPGDQP